MSHEFYQIMVGAPTMSLYSWKQLALWSIEYSCLTEEEKTKRYTIFKKSWKTFCENVVKRYGSLLELYEKTSKITREDYVRLCKKEVV